MGYAYNKIVKSKPVLKVHRNTHLLPLICALALILVIVDGYQGWAILLVGSGGVWLFSYLWAQALARGLQIQREMRYGWAQVGDRLEERFTLTNRANLPALWVEIIGQTNMPDYWANQVRSVERRSETRWIIRGTCTRRGLYTLGPTSIQTNDPFGIYTISLHNPTATTLMVTPPVLPLPQIQVAPGGRAGEGSPRRNAPEPTVSASNVRAYVPGDSLRWIHWPTSARRNEYFVRVFEGAPTGDWWIILDLDANVQIGEDQNATDEHGIILAASLTDRGMRTGHAVGLAAHGKDELIWRRPEVSDEAQGAILRSLALVEPGQVSLAKLLAYAGPLLGQNTSLIVITPAVNGAWLTSLMGIRRKGAIPTVLLFNPLTFGGLQSAEHVQKQLTSQGIHHQIISRELLDYHHTQLEQSKGDHWYSTLPIGSKNNSHREAFSWQKQTGS